MFFIFGKSRENVQCLREERLAPTRLHKQGSWEGTAQPWTASGTGPRAWLGSEGASSENTDTPQRQEKRTGASEQLSDQKMLYYVF